MNMYFGGLLAADCVKQTKSRLLGGTNLGLAVLSFVSNTPAFADPTPMQLPKVSVNGSTTAEETDEGYKTDQSSLRKLTQPILNTPQTIDAVPRQLMDDKGVTNFRDALRDVPGISLAAGEFGAQGDNLTIRGFTARNDIFLDGMRDFGSYYRDPFDLEQIEVLKGPSSIAFGRGSTGGIVEQASKAPMLDNFEAGTITFGTDATKRITADINVALDDLGPGAAFRINLMGNDSDVADRDVANNTRFGVAPSLALGLGTPTRFTLSYLHQTEYDNPDYGLPWLYQSAPTNKLVIARPSPVDRDNYYGFERGDYLRTNVDIGTAKLEHDFTSSLTLTDQLRYGHYVRSFRITEPQFFATAARGASGTALRVAPGTPLGSLVVSRNLLYGTSLETFLENQLDVSAKFQTFGFSHALVAGIEVSRETSDPNRYSSIGPFSTTPLLNPNPQQQYNATTFFSARTTTTADAQAIYAMDTVDLTEQWQVMGGFRYDRFNADYNLQSFRNPVTGVTAASLNAHHVDKEPSYRAALVYKPVSNGSIYFDYGTSFNPSAEALSLSASTADLAPEKSKTFEIGAKWEVIEERLLLSASIFHTEKENVRETDPNNSNFQILAGDAVAKGLEIEATGKLTEHWQVEGGYAYTFSEITKSPQSDLGHRLANVPAHTVSLFTTYTTPWKVEVGGGFDYVSSRFASTAPRVVGGVGFFQEAPGYVTANLMAKYPITNDVSVQVNIYNLANIEYADLLHPSHVVPGAGRSALFTANFKL